MQPNFEPMLAIRWARPFDDPDWWFEVKWDGYRAIVGKDGGKVRARSRRGINLLDPFPELGSLPVPEGVVLDGEIVAFDSDGRPSFNLIQRRTGFGGSGTGDRTSVNFVAFDILYSGDSDCLGIPYEEHRALLEGLGLPSPFVVPTPTRADGTALFEAVVREGLEGIVGKRSGSRYFPGRRTGDWRKISVRHQLRAVVGGFVEGDGSRHSTFGSLLLGLWKDGGLRFIGAVGSGFDERTLTAIRAALVEIESDTSPFASPVAYPGKLHWVAPGIIVNVEYKDWTSESSLRAPVYKGVEIGDVADITWENEGPIT